MKVFASAPAAAIVLALAVLLGATGRAAAEPTEAQLAAIKSNCRSDFMSNCWGVPRGGVEAFQCLKKHLASLSPECAQAVKAVTPPAAPAAAAKSEPEPKPTAAAEPAAVAAPETPLPAQSAEPAPAAAAPESPPPAEPAPAPKAASETASKPAAPAAAKAAPQEAPQASGEGSPAKTKSAAAPAEADETVAIIGFIPPRKKLMVLRNCRQDLDTYCPDVSYGEGRQLQCLFSKKSELSSDCQGALAKLTN